ncbi:condensin-2 complex subunit G2-like [Daktulosphaira vitifoliae]|uniref:condensin-2 complex subunit G2-like n=1 Tax=Daktulosphaira vitifoliae TaxID=58002 RepID=UPI0021AA8990|nr:condensin-2 complex subunit G2-like [Daktulosphaira vitifoliae]
MSIKTFKTIKSQLPDCNKLPELSRKILETVNDSLNDLNEDEIKELWTLLNNFLQETSASNDKDLLNSYQLILNIAKHAIDIAEDIDSIYKNKDFLKTILIFQSFYSKNYKQKFKIEIVKMCLNFWKLSTSYMQNGTEIPSCDSLDFENVMTKYFVLTFKYLFDAIMATNTKTDMKSLSSLLWEFCKVVSSLSTNNQILYIIVINLENMMRNTLLLETETGRLIFADIFTINVQLFQRYHQSIKQNLPLAKKLEAEAYGEIYFMAWINSNPSMKEIIEQQGMFDLISNTLTLKRVGKTFRTYRNALLFLKSMQSHRKHLLFSKVITKLYAPILWRQLKSEFNVVKCNATEVLAIAYPLEKRGEGRENSSRFLIKQQNAFLELLEDNCPQVRIAAIKGVCSCLRYFWNTFENDCLNKIFSLFARLIEESVFEVRKVMFYGFCQLLDENKSYNYFKTPAFIVKLKKTLYDENEKVRRAFIYFLLKIKKVDSIPENTNKINFAQIVNLNDIASALANESKQNGTLLVDLIFDNFFGEKVPDRNATLTRLNMFYKINPSACRKLLIYSKRKLDFDSACKLILSLLKTIYVALKKKEELKKKNDKENNIPAKKQRVNHESDDDLNDSLSSCNSSTNTTSDIDHVEQIKVCCILDSVSSLMLVHRNTFIEEKNHKQMIEIQDSCTSCLIKVLKIFKDGDAYFSAMHLSSLIPVSKLTAHVSAPSAALSTLKQLPHDMKHSEEEIDMRKVNCLVYTLCMWKRGYEILQFVNIWFDEAFKTMDLNETQYPESMSKERRRVRFKTDVKECKPMTGILLINSMLNNMQTQNTLVSSDVNKKNINDLFIYLQRSKLAIEKRILLNKVLDNHLLTDEVLIELFQLHLRLHIVFESHEKNTENIHKYLSSIFDWIKDILLNDNLYNKNDETLSFVATIVDGLHFSVLNICLMALINNDFLDNYFLFCATILNSFLAPRILISNIGTLAIISKYYNYIKSLDNVHVFETIALTNCTTSILSILSESKYTEERFNNVIGNPSTFRRELNSLFLGVFKISAENFKQIFIFLIETIVQIISIQIREIDHIDLNEQLTELPFAAYQLAFVILNNLLFRKYFSSNAVEIFSSSIYKNDCVLLLSAISYVYTLSFQINQVHNVDLEPVVRLFFKTLMEHESITPLGDNCTMNNIENTKMNSILENSSFSNEKMDFKQKGRTILIATAKQLRITLCE